MGKEGKIRAGVAEDYPALIDLQRRACSAGYPEPVRSVLGSNPHLIDQSFRREWIAEDQMRVAIDGNGRPVGFAVLAPSGEETELVALFVDPLHWRQGIGAALVAAMIELARTGGNARFSFSPTPWPSAFTRPSNLSTTAMST